jgi:triosephosphate isomerase
VIVKEQLEIGLSQLPKTAISEVLIAYEPVWAIGTGRSATPADASSMHRVIREKLSDIAPETNRVPILYGGSVNTKNAESLLHADGVDGLLVGSACLDPEGWAQICRT